MSAQGQIPEEWKKAAEDVARCCSVARAIAARQFDDEAQTTMMPALIVAVALSRLGNEVNGVKDAVDALGGR